MYAPQQVTPTCIVIPFGSPALRLKTTQADHPAATTQMITAEVVLFQVEGLVILGDQATAVVAPTHQATADLATHLQIDLAH